MRVAFVPLGRVQLLDRDRKREKEREIDLRQRDKGKKLKDQLFEEDLRMKSPFFHRLGSITYSDVLSSLIEEERREGEER